MREKGNKMDKMCTRAPHEDGMENSRRSEVEVRPYEVAQQVRTARYFFRPVSDEVGEAVGGRVRRAVVYGGFEVCAPNYDVERGMLAYPALEYVVGGRGWFTVGDAEWEVSRGSVFGYRVGTKVRIRSDPNSPLEKYFVCTGGAETVRLFGRTGVLDVRRPVVVDPERLRRIWDELIDEGRRRGPTADVICTALLDVLLLELGEEIGLSRRARGRSAGSRARFEHYRAWIEENASELTGLAEAADSLGTTPGELCRLFKRHGEESPARVLMRRKLALAAERLVAGGCLVKEAGAAVGMADPYHFSRAFKARFGVSPAIFRRTVVGG
jgi:AraC-like DNA-binding protein